MFHFFQEAPAQNKKPVVAKNGSVPPAKAVKANSSSDSFSDEDDVSIEANAGQNTRIPVQVLDFIFVVEFRFRSLLQKQR